MVYPVGQRIPLIYRRKVNISGIIYDADGTTPIPTATVSLGEFTAQTDVNGVYTLYHCYSGISGTIMVSKSGYAFNTLSLPTTRAHQTGKNINGKWWTSGGSLATLLLAYQPKGAASLSASYTNLANPGTYDATVWTGKNAPGFDSSYGWYFIAANTNALNTNLVGTNNMSCNIKFTDSLINVGAMMGTYTAGQVNFNLYSYYTNSRCYFRAGGSLDTAGAMTTGVIGVTPAKGYKDGSPAGNLAGSTTGSSTQKVAIGGYSDAGGIPNHSGYKCQGFSIHSGTLSDTQMAIFNNAMKLI